MVREFHDLHDVFVCRLTGEYEFLLIRSSRISLFNLGYILRVDFVTVTEAFANSCRTVNFFGAAIFLNEHIMAAKAHGSTEVLDIFLTREERDDRIFDMIVAAFHFDCACALDTANVTRKFNDGELHAVADAEERDVVFAYIADDLDFSFNATTTSLSTTLPRKSAS